MTMAAVKVREKASPFLCPSEVNGKHSSARLQNPSHLAGALLACFARQMMKHHRGQYSVELSVGKRQRLGKPILEDNLDAGLSRLLTRPGNHLRRRVDPVHRARGPDVPFGCDRKGSCPAAHIQDRLARFEARQAEHLLTKDPLPTERYQPDQEIIAGRPVQEQASRAGLWIPIRHLRDSILPGTSIVSEHAIGRLWWTIV